MNVVIAVRILLVLGFVVLWIVFGVLFSLRLARSRLPRLENLRDLRWPTVKERFFGESIRTIEFRVLILMFMVAILLAVSLWFDSGLDSTYH